MNQREKILAIAVGVTLLIAVGFGALNYVNKAFAFRRGRIAAIENQLRQADLQFEKGRMAQEELSAWESWSLPSDPEQARALYKAWLTDLVNRAGLEDPNVKADGTRKVEKKFDVHPFTVTGVANLRQLTTMLHEFYTTRQLHRIRSLTISPKGDKHVEIYMTAESVSLPNAGDNPLILADVDGLVGGLTLAEINNAILERNLFGPPNQKPTITLNASQRFEVGSRVRLKAEARDGDGDALSFFAPDIGNLPGAEFVNGELRWTPRETGDYRFSLEVVDEGVPSRRESKTIQIAVVQPARPPAPAPRPEPPKFDWSKHTQLQGIVGPPDDLVAWLKIRPLNKRLKLRVGDDFEVGELSGVVRAIRVRELEYETQGRRFVMSIEERLSDAQELTANTAGP